MVDNAAWVPSIDGRTSVLSPGESIYVPGNALQRARALDAGKLADVFTPVSEELLARG